MKHRLDRALTYLLLAVVGLLMLLPFFGMLSQSLKDAGEYLAYPFHWLPQNPTLVNYRLLFKDSAIIRWTLNSFLISAGSALLQVLTASMAAYGFTRKRFRGRDAIFWAMMVQLILPYHVSIIPIFLLLSKLRLTDTYWAFWIPFATNVFSTFLMRQAMLVIPREYDEAAKVDGATDLQIYWRVLLPMCRPTATVLVIFTFLQMWNDFFYALIMVQSDSMKTLQIGLAQLQPIGGQPGVMMAGATFAFVPTLILFLILQNRMVEGLQAGGLKG